MYWRYFKYIIEHKWNVFIECLRLMQPIHGIFHDWSKFRLSEFVPYARFFMKKNRANNYKQSDEDDTDFQKGWFLHQKRNKHHWNYFVKIRCKEIDKCLGKQGECLRILENENHCVKLSSVKDVGILDLSKIFCMEECIVRCAKNIIKNTEKNGLKNTQQNYKSGIKTMTESGMNGNYGETESVLPKQNGLYLRIMEVILLNVHVAMKMLLNFYVSIMSMGEEQNTERKLALDLCFTNGLLTKNSRKVSVCYVIIVTRLSASTDTALMKQFELYADPMPGKYVLQMIADWRGMSRKFGGSTKKYYNENKDNMILHSKTIVLIEDILN